MVLDAIYREHLGTLTTLDPGFGKNTFNIGTGDLNALQGRVVVFGNGGSNTLVLQDSGHANAEPYGITSTTITRPGFAGLTYGPVA